MANLNEKSIPQRIKRIGGFFRSIKNQALNSPYQDDAHEKYGFFYRLSELFFDTYGTREYQQTAEEQKEEARNRFNRDPLGLGDMGSILSDGDNTSIPLTTYLLSFRYFNPLRLIKFIVGVITLILDTIGSLLILPNPDNSSKELNRVQRGLMSVDRFFFGILRGIELLLSKTIDTVITIAANLLEAIPAFIQDNWKAALVILGLCAVIGIICFLTGGVGVIPFVAGLSALLVAKLSIGATLAAAMPSILTTLFSALASWEVFGILYKINNATRSFDPDSRFYVAKNPLTHDGIFDPILNFLKQPFANPRVQSYGNVMKLVQEPQQGEPQQGDQSSRTATNNAGVTSNPTSSGSPIAPPPATTQEKNAEDIVEETKNIVSQWDSDDEDLHSWTPKDDNITGERPKSEYNPAQSTTTPTSSNNQQSTINNSNVNLFVSG